MAGICIIRVFSVLILLPFLVTNAEDEEVNKALVRFMNKLSASDKPINQSWGWTLNTDPCNDRWIGVKCDTSLRVIKIVLNEFNFGGVLDSNSVCMAKSLSVLSLQRNRISGSLSEEISNCTNLTHLYLTDNKLSGTVPDSLSRLSNLKRIDISKNGFSGMLPNVARISGLLTFFAENNQFYGTIPNFDVSNLREFNVSNNNVSGPIPDSDRKFSADSFIGNPGLCGPPLSTTCPPPPPAPSEEKKKKPESDRFLMYSGYILFVLVVVFLVVFRLTRRKSKKRRVVVDSSSEKPSSVNRSEYSISSIENGMASSMLVVGSSYVGKDLRFEELLRAPAELLGRGKNGTTYKVIVEDGLVLVVKRIKDSDISKQEFAKRMQRLEEVKHPKILPVIAYYCSNQEKLLVYEYQPNGSLFDLLHGNRNGLDFDWGSRLNVATSIAEALQFMHGELWEDRISHGNLKSADILFKNDMTPCISEYGLIVADTKVSPRTSNSSMEVDTYNYGVILLELLTGKKVHSNGADDLAKWVHLVVREEWTVEVFDRVLLSEGASEERMVNMLQVALKCINPIPTQRPTMKQVMVMVNAIKDEEDRSISSEA